MAAPEATPPSPFLFALDPGSTGTKVALFAGATALAAGSLRHPGAGLAERLDAARAWLDGHAPRPLRLDAVVGRGGLLRPVPCGTYPVTDALAADLRAGAGGEHPANLGGLLARAIADAHGVPAFVVDPVSVDELDDVARVSGLAELPRRSLVHALNIRAVARRDCAARGVALADARLVVAHLGGGISIAALRGGRIVDVNNANEEGPFSPNRTGGLPAGQLADLVFGGRFAGWPECRAFLTERGGLTAYLGTDDVAEAEQRAAAGDGRAAVVLEAMAYQIGKEIGAYAAALAGRVDAVLLTGGLARHEPTVARITELAGWIAPVRTYPGEDELQALAEGALRVLAGAEAPRDYETEVSGEPLAR